jgi:hypothetical protein
MGTETQNTHTYTRSVYRTRILSPEVCTSDPKMVLMPVMLLEAKGHPMTILCSPSGKAEISSYPFATPTLEEMGDRDHAPARSKPLYRQRYHKVTQFVTIKLEVITLYVTVFSSIFFWRNSPWRPAPSHYRDFTIILRQTTLGGTPLNK